MVPAEAPAKPRPKPIGSAAFYRLCRMLHAYLSAFAFLALIFFALTGLTLNHPEWLAGARPRETSATVRLTAAEVSQAMAAKAPARALAAAVARHTPLLGAYASGEIEGGEALIRLEGPRGTSDVTVRVPEGEAEVAVHPAGAIALLNDLHKAKAAGPVWRAVVDVSAVLFLTMSLIGYVLFFSLRFRLVPSLILTAVSLAVLVGLAALFVK